MTLLCLCLSGLALSMGVVPPAHASRARALNLEQMAIRADRILAARCVEVRLGVDPALMQPVTYVTLVPQRAVKGSVRGRMTIRLLGDRTASAPPAEAIDGVPSFTAGEELVLFLYGESAAGLTSPVGFGQGKFKLLRDKEGRTHAVNGFGNAGLLEGLSPKAQERLGARVEKFRGGRAIPFDTLVEMARDLVR